MSDSAVQTETKTLKRAKPAAKTEDLLAQLAVLEEELAVSTRKFWSGAPRIQATDLSEQIGKQARRLRHMGETRQRIMQLQSTLSRRSE